MTNMIYTAMPALPKKHHTNAVVLPSEWNTCPLSSIVEEISETVGTRKIETISISAGIGFVNQAEKFGRELSGKQYEKYIVLHKGDFSYNKGNSNIYPQGCIYRLNNRTEAAVPNVFESFRVSVGNPDYYEQLFLSGFLNRQLYSKINRGVRDNGLLNLKGKDFYSCEVPYPPLAEQERIAEILIQCDHVIELKEQKLDELKQLKKEFLRKMFPAKGCDTPEIRFPGFTGAWEQHKLIDVCDYVDYRGKTPTKTDSGNFLVTAKNIKDGYIDYETSQEYISEDDYEETMHRGKPEIGDVLITTEAPCGNVAQVNKENIALAQRIIKYRGHRNLIANTYLKYYLLSPEFQNILNAKSSGGTVKGIKGSILHQQIIKYPKYEEQVKIGQDLNAINNLITLHQRELEETKKYKKTLARLLLTGIVRVKE